MLPTITAHDQEPLDFDRHTGISFRDQVVDRYRQDWNGIDPCSELQDLVTAANLRALRYNNVYDQMIILHSEKNSDQVHRYETSGDFVGCYYWSHALISLDWYRYAQHDPRLGSKSTSRQLFLIYNRSWSGSREYRLKFTDLLLATGLHQHCHMKFSSVDDGHHYHDHRFVNGALATIRRDLHLYFPNNDSPAHFSADYNTEDYRNSEIEIVLETLFDDQRLHLTEKTLRPIACGQPFILAGPAGSLEYLRSYGFQTWHGIINETYDTVADPLARLQMITQEMIRISMMPLSARIRWLERCQSIADHNRKHFFSKKFFNHVTQEFRSNIDSALRRLVRGGQHIKFNAWCRLVKQRHPDFIQYELKRNPDLRDVINLFR